MPVRKHRWAELAMARCPAEGSRAIVTPAQLMLSTTTRPVPTRAKESSQISVYIFCAVLSDCGVQACAVQLYIPAR